MPTLVSVNVGLPADVAWNGRVVYTGAWKAPVSGPRMVRGLNVDGDGQGDLGGHGGENRAVLVYQVASYRYWASELGRDDLEPGHFGENLTVDGLADDEVCIGDRYRIGDAVLEVTQPRVTCYRVGMRLGEPRMAALLVSHRRPGFYCRVLTEGEVEAGREIVKISDGPEKVTVAEIDALLYLPGHSQAALERALRIPALSAGWQGSLRSLRDHPSSGNTGLSAAASSPPPAWTGFRPLTVSSAHDESTVVRSLTLVDAEGSSLPKWQPGQSITVRLNSGDAPLIRNYSLSNDPAAGEYRISVKREPHGAGSGYLHSHVRAGDRLEVAAPRGAFFMSGGDGPVLLMSAGVGITPTLSMLHELADMVPARPVWWLHGTRSGAERAFAVETGRLLDQLPDSRSHVMYSRPQPDDRLGVDYDEQGRLSADTVRALGVPRDAEAYLCGPVSFMAELSAGLVADGFDSGRIHMETFGAGAALTPGIATVSVPPHLPAPPPGAGPEIQFARSAVAAPWGSQYLSILEFAEACDVPTRWSCRTGVCHNCETALLSGTVRYDPEPLAPPADGNILICCSQPTSAVVVDL